LYTTADAEGAASKSLSNLSLIGSNLHQEILDCHTSQWGISYMCDCLDICPVCTILVVHYFGKLLEFVIYNFVGKLWQDSQLCRCMCVVQLLMISAFAAILNLNVKHILFLIIT
jgi:hypothetical protein